MKSPFLHLLLIITLICGSCDEEAPIAHSPTGYIKATVNGIEKDYHTLPDTTNGSSNWRTKSAIYINYLKGKRKSEYWSISIYFPDTTTLQNMKVPFVIKGPNPDFTGGSPEGHTLILDPLGAPYGKYIAGSNTFHNDFSLTITFFEGDMIKGTFSGGAEGNIFTDGEFAAKLVLY